MVRFCLFVLAENFHRKICPTKKWHGITVVTQDFSAIAIARKFPRKGSVNGSGTMDGFFQMEMKRGRLLDYGLIGITPWWLWSSTSRHHTHTAMPHS